MDTKMLQHQIAQSPARLGLTNPNSPSIQNPILPKLPPSMQTHHQHAQQQNQQNHTSITYSSNLVSLLPPLPRAQSLLVNMASLTSKLFEVSPNRSTWVSAFRGSLPTFLSSQTQSADTSPATAKEILANLTCLQTQLFEAVSELQEILDLQDVKQKVAREIRAKDSALLAFANKLKDAERVLDMLVDDYADYRRPKRSKLQEADEDEEQQDEEGDSLLNTTVSSQLKLSDTLAYAHRISYTTFAPPEFGAGQAPLRGALPPAPQDEQMRASQLYNFADLDVGLPKAVENKGKAVEAIMEPPPPEPEPMDAIARDFLPPNITVPPGWNPSMGLPLPVDLKPPPGWKIGDPIPKELLPIPAMELQQLRPLAPLHHKPPETIQVQHVELDILDQDTDSSDYSSDDGSSDSEV